MHTETDESYFCTPANTCILKYSVPSWYEN